MHDKSVIIWIACTSATKTYQVDYLRRPISVFSQKSPYEQNKVV